MTRSNVDAIFAEYPFLSTLVPRARVSDARVARWDEDFLRDGPCFYKGGTSKEVYLLDMQGTLVYHVDSYKSNSLWEKIARNIDLKPRETIDEALVRIGEEKMCHIRYAVSILHGRSITLFKVPMGYSNVADWYKALTEETREKMRAM